MVHHTFTLRGLCAHSHASVSLRRDPTAIVLAPGGISAAGIIGQISGALELAGQIQDGVTEDLDCLVLPVGSSCTLAGLIIGVALSRALGLRAFRKPAFRVVAVPIHPALGYLERRFGFFKSHVSTLSYAIRATCRLLCQLDASVPRDLEEMAIRTLEQEVRFEAAAELVGKYA
jgi:1-aminocyclopropane-1-carboxylate deaminase/D-cysteine desulfhydrase-like pyridoxal-dependent ACC family enzyme